MSFIKILFIFLSIGFSHVNFDFLDDKKIQTMSKQEKQLLYNQHKKNSYLNAIYPIPPFTGYYRVGHIKRGMLKFFAINLLIRSFTAMADSDGTSGGVNMSDEALERRIDHAARTTMAITVIDLYFQTNKYNRKLYKRIFKEDMPLSKWDSFILEIEKMIYPMDNY